MKTVKFSANCSFKGRVEVPTLGGRRKSPEIRKGKIIN